MAAIGDSITAGSPWDDDPEIGWPAAAAAADPRLRFTVRAVYGKRTDEIAAWLDDAAAGAEVLVVQGGINDIAQGRPVADAAANLRAMIDRGLELGLRVAVANVLPWNNALAGSRGADPRVERAHRRHGSAGAVRSTRRSRIPTGQAGCARTGRSRAIIRRSTATGDWAS